MAAMMSLTPDCFSRMCAGQDRAGAEERVPVGEGTLVGQRHGLVALVALRDVRVLVAGAARGREDLSRRAVRVLLAGGELVAVRGPGQDEVGALDRRAVGPHGLVVDRVLDRQRVVRGLLERPELLVRLHGAVDTEGPEAVEHLVEHDGVLDGVLVGGVVVVRAELLLVRSRDRGVLRRRGGAAGTAAAAAATAARGARSQSQRGDGGERDGPRRGAGGAQALVLPRVARGSAGSPTTRDTCDSRRARRSSLASGRGQ